MNMNSKQKEILDFLERNTCTEIGSDDGFQEALLECESERQVTELLKQSACYFSLVSHESEDWIEELGIF